MNAYDNTGTNKKLDSNQMDPAARAELEEAGGRFMNALCKAFPRAAGELMAGSLISVVTRKGTLFRIAAGGQPVSDSGLILPG